jgi:hypothetical protein
MPHTRARWPPAAPDALPLAVPREFCAEPRAGRGLKGCSNLFPEPDPGRFHTVSDYSHNR